MQNNQDGVLIFGDDDVDKTGKVHFVLFFFSFFFSSRRRHTDFALVAWARRCVYKTDVLWSLETGHLLVGVAEGSIDESRTMAWRSVECVD